MIAAAAVIVAAVGAFFGLYLVAVLALWGLAAATRARGR